MKPARASGPHRASASATVALLLASTLLALIAGQPAAAYPVSAATFSDGSTQAAITFGASDTTLQGPKLRVPTNATVTSASVTVSGQPFAVNQTRTKTTTGDFAAGVAYANIAATNGSLLVATTSAVRVFDSTNSFGGGTFINTSIVGGRLVLAAGKTAGSYTTLPIDVPGGNWGYLTAAGNDSFLGNLTFSVLDIQGAVLLASIEPGSRIGADPSLYPRLVIRISMDYTFALLQPSVEWFKVGQQTGDSFLGSAVSRQPDQADYYSDGGASSPNLTSFTRASTNPVFTSGAAPDYWTRYGEPHVVETPTEFRMYLTVSNGGFPYNQAIGVATSPDMVTWTLRPGAILKVNATNPEYVGISSPFVFPRIDGSGWVMYYVGWRDDFYSSIARAESPDGFNWTKTGQVLAPAPCSPCRWDTGRVGPVAGVLYLPWNGTWLVWYAGAYSAGLSLGVATTQDTMLLTRFGTTPVYTDPGGAYDAYGGKIVIASGLLQFYYGCAGAICLATSYSLGFSFISIGTVFGTGSASWESVNVLSPSPIATATSFHLFYTGRGPGPTFNIGRAAGTFKAGNFSGQIDLVGGGNPPDFSVINKTSSTFLIDVAGGTHYTAWVSDPVILDAGDEWWMYMTTSVVPWHNLSSLSRARSTNLVYWTMDAAPVLTRNASLNETYGLSHPYVLHNPVGWGYVMYYTAWKNATRSFIARAVSDDGVTWTRQGAVLNASGFSWDSVAVGLVSRVEFDAATGVWRMWYSGTALSTGLGWETGLATSTDGVTWTRSSYNPVVRLGAFGNPDVGNAAGGKMARVAGTLLYYYDCSNFVVNSTCLAQSTDGIYWYKSYRVLIPGPDLWDGRAAASAMPLFTADAFFLYYSGLQGAFNTVSRIGRATGAFSPAAPAAWGPLPEDVAAGLLRFRAQVQPSPGSTYYLQLRSSPDRFTWSAWEIVSNNDVTLSTPADRYIEYRIHFNASASRSWIRGVTLDTASSAEVATYVSDPIFFADPMERVRVSAVLNGTGSVRWSVSLDDGASFLSIPDGGTRDLGGAVVPVRLRASVHASSRVPLAIESLTLVARTNGLPADVRVQVGAGGTQQTVSSGPFGGSAVVALYAPGLNAAVAAALTTNPFATYADVPILVTSSHFGRVLLSAPNFTYVLRNPLQATFAPSGNPVIRETDPVSFTINASTLPGVPLFYSWKLDGAPLPAAGATLQWTPGYGDAGTHTLEGSVGNDDFTLSHVWSVVVSNRNRAPVITATQPPTSAIDASPRASFTFRADALDPDLDPLTYAWSVDGVPVPSAAEPSLALPSLSAGTHDIRVGVNDGLDVTSFNWTVNVADRAPTIVAVSPSPSAFSTSHRTAAVFSVEAEEPDGDALTYTWYVDGVLRPGAAGNETELTSTAGGSHRVRVVVSDGAHPVEQSWDVTFTNSPPVLTESVPAAGALSGAAPSVFRVNMTDGDGDPLAFVWTLDGTTLGPMGPDFRLPPSLAAGAHNLSVVATDPLGASARASWSFVGAEPPEPYHGKGRQPSTETIPFALIVGAAGIAGAAAVAFVVLRRRRGDDVPPP